MPSENTKEISKYLSIQDKTLHTPETKALLENL